MTFNNDKISHVQLILRSGDLELNSFQCEDILSLPFIRVTGYAQCTTISSPREFV